MKHSRPNTSKSFDKRIATLLIVSGIGLAACGGAQSHTGASQSSVTSEARPLQTPNSTLPSSSMTTTRGNEQAKQPSITTEQAARPIVLTPNMVGFLKPGTNDICYNGGLRPCAILLRVKPELSSDYINANPDQGRVMWPVEAYNGHSGDGLTVECYDPNGESVTAYEDSTSSTDWYEVVITKQHVLNPVVQLELNQPHSSIATIHRGDQTVLLGWASVEWFDESTPIPNVSACKS
jgi:hypothetical protein